jgi:hypothetical protein
VDDEVVATHQVIYDLNPLEDGTVVELVQLTGDIDRLSGIATDLSDVTFMVTSGRTGLVYVHFDPGKRNKALFDIIGTHKISISNRWKNHHFPSM